MVERIGAFDLLQRARAIYDNPVTGLAGLSRAAWRGGFTTGGEWMRQVFAQLRGQAPRGPASHFQRLGVVKYGLACTGALACVFLALALAQPLVLLLVVPAFYAIEAQMVFLFPLVLDGSAAPFVDSRRWTVRAGGTLVVMRVVLPLAATMPLGGFAGQGFVRSWSLGCLAVCLWYEQVRAVDAGQLALKGSSPT